MFAHPIFSEKGDYPEVLKKKVSEKSKQEGYSRSRLPEFDEFWINYIKGTVKIYLMHSFETSFLLNFFSLNCQGTSDYFGFNHYTTVLATYGEHSRHPKPSFHSDHGVVTHRDGSWSRGNEWLNVVPWGFRKALNWVKNQYNDPVIYITENGFSDDEEYNDMSRINYFHVRT